MGFSDRIENAVPSDPGEINDPRALILHAYVPHIAVHTSADTDELTAEKGFRQGLWQLLRPYGESLQGKVTIRDSVGASKTCEDFAVQFVQLTGGAEEIIGSGRASVEAAGQQGVIDDVGQQQQQGNSMLAFSGGDVAAVEELVDRHLAYDEQHLSMKHDDQAGNVIMNSPFYKLYLQRLLSAIPMTPQETFSHPVACIIAISSRNRSPIEALRQLYEESTNGDKRLPPWVHAEYLRYYVLVHDEEKDDITKSMSLFENMKRHFGLHCHLLRLRSSQCIITDDDAIPFPMPNWISATEELATIKLAESNGGVEESLCIYESDATALRTFIREMVTQSVVPSMERCISTWNDQVASRRRGIGGRMLNMTKKWTGFGAKTTATAGASNYNAQLGFYRYDTPEALMRKLADYAFMLRDWRLAQTTYDFCRSDYDNDKAWIYHAAANEMAAISILMSPQQQSSKSRQDTISQMLDAASYSYITRCSVAYEPLRCLVLSMELLKLRAGSAADDAARLGARLLEQRLVGAVGDALVKERIAACYSSWKGTGSRHWGARMRKSAFWSILAAHGWMDLGRVSQAKAQLQQTRSAYANLVQPDGITHFEEARRFLLYIEQELVADQSHARSLHEPDDIEVAEEEVMDVKQHRKSFVTGANVGVGILETAKLASAIEGGSERDDRFV